MEEEIPQRPRGLHMSMNMNTSTYTIPNTITPITTIHTTDITAGLTLTGESVQPNKHPMSISKRELQSSFIHLMNIPIRNIATSELPDSVAPTTETLAAIEPTDFVIEQITIPTNDPLNSP